MAPGSVSRRANSRPPPLHTQSECIETQPTLSNVEVTIENLSAQTNDSSGASTGSRRGRGKACGHLLAKATHGGQKVQVTIPDKKYKPVGEWAAQFTTEVGIACRSFGPIAADGWARITEIDKEHIY